MTYITLCLIVYTVNMCVFGYKYKPKNQNVFYFRHISINALDFSKIIINLALILGKS